MNSILFTIVKNDNQWLDEWVRYHLAIGFSHILMYDNNDGMDDYPMSDYIISQCTNKHMTIVNKRNLLLDKNYEFNNISISYDYAIMLMANEFLSFKCCFANINDFLSNKRTNLYVERIPFDVIGNVDKINIAKYKCYLPSLFKKHACNETQETNEIYIKKILSIE